MKIQKKPDLHVVRDEEEIIIDKLLTELKDEDMTEDELIKQQEEEKKEIKKKIIKIRNARRCRAFLCTYSVQIGFLPRSKNTRSRIQQIDVPAKTQIRPTTSITALLVHAPLTIR